MKKLLKGLVVLTLIVSLFNVGLSKGDAAITNKRTYNEKESNNSLKKANNLEKYFPQDEETKLIIKGKHNGQSDVDYYKFTTNHKYTNIKMTIDIKKLPVGSVQILDSKGNRVFNGDEDYRILYAPLLKGTYYIKVTTKKKSANKNYQIAITAKEWKPNVSAKVENNLGEKDSITLKNLKVGGFYIVYWDYYKSKYKVIRPKKSTVTIPIGPLKHDGGTVYFYSSEILNPEEQMIPIKYSAEKLKPLNEKKITIKNKTGGKDTIKLEGLKKGYTYKIYKDAKLEKKLASYTAKKKTSATLNVKLNKNGGSVYVVVSKSGYKTSDATKVSYKAEPTKTASK